MKSKELLELVVKAIDDRKGEDIVALEVDGVTPLADYFVMTHASSRPQLEAIVRSVLEACDEAGISVKSVEGRESPRWTLIDLVDVIVHVFSEDARTDYQLESMWQDAPLVAIDDWLTED